MCQRTRVRKHAYANKSRRMYVRDVRHLSNPVKHVIVDSMSLIGETGFKNWDIFDCA